MIGVLLLSHGEMAKGLLDSCELFFGEDIPKTKAVCLEADDSTEKFDKRIEESLAELDDGSGVLILCDLIGGTPSNRSLFVINDKVQAIAGMNLAVLMEFLSMRPGCKDIAEVDIDALLEVGRKGLVSLNQLLKEKQGEQ